MACRTIPGAPAVARNSYCGTCSRSLGGTRFVYKTSAVRDTTFCSVNCLQIKVDSQTSRAALFAPVSKQHLGFNSKNLR
jgi:hypothetical protein